MSTDSGVPGNPIGRPVLEEPELEAALQLLVERAQYITGATGTALALPQGDEMVCRASAGSCAPAVGARLQVRSGLTGESISRRQLLRCDNAETDPRVNLETCRALGIASIVVLPLLRRNGEVRGLFELFSDHPYAFEERDLIALERMADLTLTALDLAEQRHGSVPPPPAARPSEATLPETKEPEILAGPVTSAATASAPAGVVPVEPARHESADAAPALISAEAISGEFVPAESPELPTPEQAAIVLEDPAPQPAALPDAMLRVQKCSSCGFPVSEGRTLCLDCEKKEIEKKRNAKPVESKQSETGLEKKLEKESDLKAEPSAALVPDEVLPPFLANAQPVKESWLANHVNLLAILVLIVGVLVAVVVFR